MSSFKKASKVNQKVHRERHQPADRAHLGLLEKKKDFKVRADDYNAKKRAIKKLRKAALDRNPDEFYFHMINSGTREGVHFEKKKPDSEETLEQKKIMESKSVTYVAMKRTIENKKVEKLQSELHLVDLATRCDNKHIRFDDYAESSGSSGTALGLNNSSLDDAALMKLAKLKKARYAELLRRIDRKEKLTAVQQKLEIAKALKSDKNVERPKLVKPATKMTAAVYKWKYERKR
ncbi:U3 small nucleolar [Nesidiocoris tenuis]|uniref:U3 small nucleolar RNA-associated protein 11 n=1 Tax=Nesidiocoris tenuis TaxID=355587 RepID=A0ABN7A7X5_9HEMI|nr:U3 small nucleolar [Nesidiocoris tenuis]